MKTVAMKEKKENSKRGFWSKKTKAPGGLWLLQRLQRTSGEENSESGANDSKKPTLD